MSCNSNQIRYQVKEGLTLSRKTPAVQEKMCTIFYASLARTGWFRAMKIVIIPVTTKATEFDTKPSKQLNSVQVVNIKNRSFYWSHYLYQSLFEFGNRWTRFY